MVLVWTVTIGLVLCTTASAAPVVFSSSLDNATGMTITADADTAFTFGYDYSADGIPEAPNSVGGAATTGLKMEANISTGALNEIAAVTTGLGALTGKYNVQADIWVNANGPWPGGGSGSTEFAGVGVGHDGVETGRDAASMIFDGEGGSSYDYRLYKDTGLQYPASGQYAVDSPNNSGVDLSAAFPGLAAPASQQTAYAQQTGTTANGSGGFQWMTLLVEVDTNAIGSGITTDTGLAKFTLTSATSGNTVVIGTIDNSNGGTVVDMSGNVALIYGDLFSSVSDNAALSFGVFDNLTVEVIPEPTSLVLFGLSSLALVGRRRR